MTGSRILRRRIDLPRCTKQHNRFANYNQDIDNSSKFIVMNITNTQLRDLLWTSMRYCIGRHTGFSANHAYTIAEIMKNNPNLDPLDLAKDIEVQLLILLRQIDPRGGSAYDKFLNWIPTEEDAFKFLDLQSWFELYQYLDPQVEITTDDGQTGDAVCILSRRADEVKRFYMFRDKFSPNRYLQTVIPEENIKSIKRLS